MSKDIQNKNKKQEQKTGNHEDDINYDVVVLKEFDLALRKFITAVSKEKRRRSDEKREWNEV